MADFYSKIITASKFSDFSAHLFLKKIHCHLLQHKLPNFIYFYHHAKIAAGLLLSSAPLLLFHCSDI
jgi:hypothetical protein